MVRILHVDDEETVYILTRENLLELDSNLEFTWAESGKRALELLSEGSFDCILSDFQMPKMDGLQLLKTVREKDDLTPFIFITGQGNEEIAVEAFRVGAADYFTKEVGFAHYDRLLNSIKNQVKRKCESTERKRIEEALQESELRFRLSMEQSPSVIEVYDLTGLQIEVNKAYEVLWGFPASHTLNEFNVLKSKEVEKTGLMDYVKRAYSGEVVTVPDYKFDSTGETEGHGIGRERWLSTRIFPLKDTSGKVKNIVISHEDITDTRNMLDALRASEERLGLTLKDSKVTAFNQDQDLRYTWVVNPPPGLTVEQMLGETDDDLVPHADAVILTELKRRVLEQGIKESMVVRFSVDKQVFFYDLTLEPLRDIDSKVIGISGTAADVTDLKNAEESLREREEFFRSLSEVSPVGIYRTDTEGNCVHANEKWAEISGFSPSQALGSGWKESLHPDDREEIFERWHRCVKSNSLFNMEYRLERPDGKIIWVLGRAKAERNSDGTISGYMGTVTDITDRKRYEDELSRYERIVFCSKDMMALLDNNFVYLAANGEYLKAFGKNREELVGQRIPDVVGEEFFEKTIRANAERCLNGNDVYYQDWFEFPETGKQYMDITYFPYIENKKVKGFAVIGRNITVRKRVAEEAELFAKMLNDSSQPFCVGTPDGKLVNMNPAFCELTGYTKEELINNVTWNETLTPQKWRDFESDVLQTLLKTGKPQRFGKEYTRKNGSTIPVELFVHRKIDNEGNLECVYGFVTDISKHKEIYDQRVKLAADESALTGNSLLDDTNESSMKPLKLANMNIGRRLFWGFGLLLSLTVLVGGLSVFQMNKMESLNARMYNHPLAGSNALRDIRANIRAMQRAMKDVVLARDQEHLNNAHKSVDRYKEEVFQSFHLLEQRFSGDIKHVKDAHKAFADWEEIRHEVISCMEKGEREKAAEIADGKGAQHVAFMDQEIQYMADYAGRKAEEFYLKVQGIGENFFRAMIFFIILSLILSVVTGLLISRSVTEPINTLMGYIKNIGEGNFHEKIPVNRTDEIGNLSLAFNSMLDKLEQTTTSIHLLNREVVERKAVELTLRESEQRFSFALSGSKITVFNQDKDLRYTWVYNPHSALAPDQILGKTDEDLVTASDAAALTDFKLRVMAKEDSEKGVFKFTVGDKTLFYDVSILPRRDMDGKIVGILGVSTDITDQKQAEIDLEKMNIDLLEKNKEMEQFVYITSHDLKSPALTIQGFVKLLDAMIKEVQALIMKEDTPRKIREELTSLLTEDIPENIHFIEGCSKKIQKLIEGLLSLSRVGRISLTLENLDMNLVLQNVKTTFNFTIHEKGASVDVLDLPSCTGDQALIDQVFSNLLGNALKYLHPERAGQITISGKTKNARAIYCVEDNGIGVSPSLHTRIFEIFHRVDPHAGEGEGLGLATVQKILVKHGGTVWVESELDQGTKIFVSLPAGIET